MTRKPIVLFVDADRMARTMFDFRAAMLDIPHYIADSAEAAVTILEEHRVDAVVTDLVMPKYDGVDLIRCLRETELTRDTPIIVFTVGANPQKTAEAMSAGANEVLMKQITSTDKLVERICSLTHDALSREAAFSTGAPGTIS